MERVGVSGGLQAVNSKILERIFHGPLGYQVLSSVLHGTLLAG